MSPRDRSAYATCCSEPRGGAGAKHGLPATASQVRRGIACSHSGRRLCAKHGRYGRPARGRLPSGRGWPRLAEAGGRLELALALVGRAGGRIGRSLWAAAFHRGSCRSRLLARRSSSSSRIAAMLRGSAPSPACAVRTWRAYTARTQCALSAQAVMYTSHAVHMHMRMERTVVGEHQLAHQHELADLVRQLGQPVVGEDEPLERHGQRHVHGAQRAALEGEHAQLRQLRDRWRHLVAVRGRARGRFRFRLGREFGPGLGLGPRSGSGPGSSGAIGLRSLTLTLATPPPRSRSRGGTAPQGRAAAQVAPAAR